MAKRIEFNQYGNADVLQYVDYEIPTLKADEVLIENKAISINFIDTYYRSGLYPVANLPSGLGGEASGVVKQVGSEVKDLAVGDRVVYFLNGLGAYSERLNVPASRVVKLPEDISFEQAAAAFMKGLTVYYLLNNTYKPAKDEMILFHATAGGVGLIACQWAKALGLKLIGTAGSDDKVKLSLEKGAWQMINYSTEDIAKRVLEITEGKKLKVVYDSVGKSTWEASLDCLRPLGLMVSFGNASGAVTGVDLGILNKKGGLFVTRPSTAWYYPDHASMQLAAGTLFQLIGAGLINVDVPENQKFALKDVKQAHQQLESRQKVGSSLLIP